MHAKKAMVSKIKNGHCMIVTDDGQFRRIPLPRKPVQVGQIIDYQEPSNQKWFKPLFMVASFLIVFVGLYAYQQSVPPGPLTYLTLDINPSIQLGLNKNDAVVEAIPLNSDGEKLLINLAYQGRSYDVFVEDLVTEAANQGFLVNNEENVIVASLYNQAPSPQEQAQELKVRKSISQSLEKKKLKADVMVYKVDKKVWQEAKKSGLSAGKLAFSKEMQAKGMEISASELKNNSVKKILKSNLWQNKAPNIPAEVPGQKVRPIKKDLQVPKSLQPNKPNQANSRKNPTFQRPDSAVSETVYHKPPFPQERKKPLQFKPERPIKKLIEKRNEKNNPKKPGD